MKERESKGSEKDVHFKRKEEIRRANTQKIQIYPVYLFVSVGFQLKLKVTDGPITIRKENRDAVNLHGHMTTCLSPSQLFFLRLFAVNLDSTITHFIHNSFIPVSDASNTV